MKRRGPVGAHPYRTRTAATPWKLRVWTIPLALLLVAAAANGLEWAPTAGPYGAVIYAFHDGQDGSMLVGTDSGEVYRTVDSAKSWTFVSDGLPKSVLSLIEKDGLLYAGTDGRGVWRSEDHGVTWENLDRTTLVHPIVRSMAILDGALYVGTAGGMSRFDEGGDYPETWSTLIGGLRNVLLNELQVVDGTLFAGTNGGVYSFDLDSGRWTELNGGLVRANGLTVRVRTLAAHGNTLFAGTGTQGIFRSTDMGKSWARASVGLEQRGADKAAVNVLDILASARGLVAAIAGQGMYISRDDGETWSPYSAGTPNLYTYALHDVGGDLFAATFGTGIYRSPAGSDTWTYSSEGIRDTSVFALASDGAILYMGGSGGIFVSHDAGASWVPSDQGLGTLNIRALNVVDGRVYAGTRQDGFYVSNDEGVTWSRGAGAIFDRLTVRDVIRVGSRYFAATAGQGVLVSLSDSGPWKQTNSGLAFPYVRRLSAIDGRFYAGTDGQGVFVSDDDAASWSKLGSGLEKPFVYALAKIDTRLFLATYGGGVYELVGDIWEPRSVGLASLNVRALVAVGDTLYAGTAEAGVFVSEDGGVSWEEANDGWRERHVRVLLTVGDTLYAGTARGGVYKASLR